MSQEEEEELGDKLLKRLESLNEARLSFKSYFVEFTINPVKLPNGKRVKLALRVMEIDEDTPEG